MTKQIKMQMWPKEKERKNVDEKCHGDAEASSLVTVV